MSGNEGLSTESNDFSFKPSLRLEGPKNDLNRQIIEKKFARILFTLRHNQSAMKKRKLLEGPTFRLNQLYDFEVS